MGWTCTRKPDSPKAFIDTNLTWSHGDVTNKPLRSAFVGLTYYAAIETTYGDGRREVWAAVTLVRYSRDEYGFCTKDMTEHMGPVEAKCPRSILELLTPTEDANALEWRRRCLEHHDKRKAASASQPGTVVSYGGSRYRLDRLDRKGTKRGSWWVTRVSDSRTFLMRGSQLAKSTQQQ